MIILPINKKNINKAVEIMKKGGVVVYPTETAYGLGCDATNRKAIDRIFKIKKRVKSKDLPIICAHKAMVARFFKVGKIERQLASEYWPGPLTIILPTSYKLISTSSKEVAVRVSSDDVARALSRGLGKPIISTSANISGSGAIYDIDKIIKNFKKQKHQPDLILDADKLPLKKPSTIVKVEDGKIDVLREGEIKLD